MIQPAAQGLLLVVLACGLDRLVGDPRWCPHPVVVMGWWIARLRRLAEAWAGDRAGRLRLAGALITLLLVGVSTGAGWGLEALARQSPLPPALGWALLVPALASALAGRSLEQAVQAVLAAVRSGAEPTPEHDGLEAARSALAWIVGRDTRQLDRAGILRAAAETASENAVDGQFAPLFWMLVGAALWALNARLPGPLALAWGFKATSTLDSMLGYRHGRLRWLGTAGARLDDLLVWLPCRLVVLSLPLVQGHRCRWWQQLRRSLEDGRPDPSPNAGVSQAAFAHAAGVQLGGRNRYVDGWKDKPVLAAGNPAADAAAVERILQLSRRLTLLWLALAAAIGLPCR